MVGGCSTRAPGEGRALQHLAEAWRLTPYANELDTDRAAECQARFGPIQAVQGDLYTLRASLGSFSALWVNPPYTWDMGGTDDKRRELAMLKYCLEMGAAGRVRMLGGVRAPRHPGRSGVPGETQPARWTSGGCRDCTWASTCTSWSSRRKAIHRKTRRCSPSVFCKTRHSPAS